MGFIKSDADPNLYYLVVENDHLILVLYVDDLFITSVEGRIQEFKRQLEVEFDMKDLGLVHSYMGLKVWKKNMVKYI